MSHPVTPPCHMPCVVLRLYYVMDQWVTDATVRLIINYYTSVDQNEQICSNPCPQSSAGLELLSLTPAAPVHLQHQGNMTCLQTTSASPHWPQSQANWRIKGTPAELLILSRLVHCCGQTNWLQETFQSIFSFTPNLLWPCFFFSIIVEANSLFQLFVHTIYMKVKIRSVIVKTKIK